MQPHQQLKDNGQSVFWKVLAVCSWPVCSKAA